MGELNEFAQSLEGKTEQELVEISYALMKENAENTERQRAVQRQITVLRVQADADRLAQGLTSEQRQALAQRIAGAGGVASGAAVGTPGQ